MSEVVFGRPTKSGNGFTAGMIYQFKLRAEGNLARAINDNGHVRYECYPFGERSAHLWNGEGVYQCEAGRFVEVK